MIDRLIADRFRVTELAARHGPITIYDAVDLETGRQVVVKRVGAPLATDPDFVEHWRAQLQSVRALKEPSVPEILEFTVGQAELLQVETPPPGLPLGRYAGARNILPLEEALALVRAITDALTPIHRSGVSHGALNPTSVSVAQSDGPFTAFLAGWELGEIVTATSETPHALPEGVARYLAPEQIGPAAPPPTPTADVYALGLILYELLTGDHPFGVAPEDPILARLTHTPVAPSRYNPDIPPAIERVILRTLSRDPAERPPHAGALATALRQAALAPPATPARRTVTTVVERIPAPPRDRPAWVLPAMIGGALVALLLFSVLLFQLARRPPATPVATGTVPSLVGLPLDEAQLLARREELTVSVGATQSGSGQPPNTILAQQPPAGALPPASRVISVTLASEPTPVALATAPNLYAQRLDVAELMLTQAGLRLGAVREAHSDLVPRGLILEQNPRAGLQVPTGTMVDVIVSLGLPPGTAEPELEPSPAPEIRPSPTEPAYSLPGYPGVPPTATQPPAPTQAPARTATRATTAEAALLFQDDFSTNDAGWTTAETVDYRGEVRDGLYRIVVYATDGLWWTQAGRDFADFRYEADVSWVEEQEPGQGLGVVFRVTDADHFYLYEIDQEGGYRIRRRDGAEWISLAEDSPAPAIKSGLATNRLAVEAIGDLLRFEANGEVIAEVQDDAYASGDLGLAAVNEGSTTLTGEFDNVRVVER